MTILQRDGENNDHMPFPLSITGHVKIPLSQLATAQSPVDRLRDALLAQTVDEITIKEDQINFRPETSGKESKLRPEDNGWMLGALANCHVDIDRKPSDLVVHYELQCSGLFYLVTAFSVAIGTIILFAEDLNYIFWLGLRSWDMARDVSLKLR